MPHRQQRETRGLAFLWDVGRAVELVAMRPPARWVGVPCADGVGEGTLARPAAALRALPPGVVAVSTPDRCRFNKQAEKKPIEPGSVGCLPSARGVQLGLHSPARSPRPSSGWCGVRGTLRARPGPAPSFPAPWGRPSASPVPKRQVHAARRVLLDAAPGWGGRSRWDQPEG